MTSTPEGSWAMPKQAGPEPQWPRDVDPLLPQLPSVTLPPPLPSRAFCESLVFQVMLSRPRLRLRSPPQDSIWMRLGRESGGGNLYIGPRQAVSDSESQQWAGTEVAIGLVARGDPCLSLACTSKRGGRASVAPFPATAGQDNAHVSKPHILVSLGVSSCPSEPFVLVGLCHLFPPQPWPA